MRYSFIGALLLAGCVGPNYHRPETAVPADWQEAQLGGVTNSPLQVVEWWKTFNDPELNSLIDRAVKTNLDLRIAQQRVREARALRSGVTSYLFPSGDVSASYTRSRRSLSVPAGNNAKLYTDNYEAGFDASWEIDLFGGVRRGVEAANAALGAAIEDQHDVLLTVLAEVARNYVEARGFQRRLMIAQQNIKAQEEAVEITNLRFHAGLTSDLDVKQAEALLAALQAAVPTIDTGLKQSVHRLGVLLGQQPGALITELAAVAPIPATPPTVPVGLPSDLLRRRPDVRQAERQLAAATALIGVAMSDYFPKVSLTGAFGIQSDGINGFDLAGKFWSLGPTIRWPILDAWRISQNVRAANSRQQQALAIYEKTVLIAFEDVENALVAYANEQVRYRALKDAVAANRRALELADDLYTKGLGDFLNVVVAQRSLYQIEDQLVDSERTVTENLVSLFKALGGGWESDYANVQASE